MSESFDRDFKIFSRNKTNFEKLAKHDYSQMIVEMFIELFGINI